MVDTPDFALMSQSARAQWMCQALDALAIDRHYIIDGVTLSDTCMACGISLDELLDEVRSLPVPEDECYYECPWLEPGEEA